jgi:hypothetical protein
MKSSTHTYIPLAAGVMLASAASLHAVELADLAGDWTFSEFSTPTRLRETFYNTVTTQTRLGNDSSDFAQTNEVLTDAHYFDPLFTATRTFNLSPTGAVTGGETGQVLTISSNRISYSDGTELTTVYSSITGDVLLNSGREIESQEQTLCLKRPTDLTQSDLEGAWYLISMENPKDLSRNYSDGRLVDTFFEGDHVLNAGDIDVDGAGNFTGLFDGTISGSANGDMTVTIPPSAPDPEQIIPFKINASKNVMVGTTNDTAEDGYNILVKKPATLTTAELAGTWRVSAIQVPRSLTEVFYNTVTTGRREDDDNSHSAQTNEILVDVFHRDKFDLTRLHATIDTSGNLVAATESGTITANGDKTVSLDLGDEVIVLHPNADKTLMIAPHSFALSHESRSRETCRRHSRRSPI